MKKRIIEALLLWISAAVREKDDKASVIRVCADDVESGRVIRPSAL